MNRIGVFDNIIYWREGRAAKCKMAGPALQILLLGLTGAGSYQYVHWIAFITLLYQLESNL